jgi:hypothetical protein
MSMRIRLLLVALLTLLTVSSTHAQTPALPAVPAAYQLNGVQHYYQTWNNCGPATLSMALSYYGYTDDQAIAAAWLKPNPEDKNVSPWQMAEYVNTQLPGTLRAIIREGGSLDLVKLLISQNFPVIMEAGYDPPNDPQGWMGHYLMVYGYDDALGILRTMDSFEGPNYTYEYAYIDEFWRHFNRLYMVVYPIEREQELMMLLGSDADETQNWNNALATARAEAVANPNDPYAWFNMGTNFVGLGDYESAALAFDQARNVGEGLPFRMLWYQFGPFEAYYNVGRYNDMVMLAQALLNDGGGQLIEETYYYGGLARMGLGEIERARSNFDQAIFFNPNFTPARDALAQLDATG